MSRGTVHEPEHAWVRLLRLLERLLAMQGIEVRSTLDEASQLLSEAIQADKIDVFILDPATNTQVAVGVSDTPMGAKQRSIGLDRLPLANGGREAEVYHNGQPYLSGHVDLDTGVLRGFRFDLAMRSMIIVPLDVAGERRGTIQVASMHSEAFIPEDVAFVQGVAVIVELETIERDEGRRAVIAVHDAGPGVPAAMIPRLFSRFAAGPDSSGLGLGLYMARTIAEAHGGRLTYDPPTQGGATFQLELPLTTGDPAGEPEFGETQAAVDSGAAVEQRPQ